MSTLFAPRPISDRARKRFGFASREASAQLPRGLQRAPFERMAWVFHEISRGKTFTSADYLQRFEISSRAMQRDFDFLRDRFEVPLEYNPSTNTWGLAHRAVCPFCNREQSHD